MHMCVGGRVTHVCIAALALACVLMSPRDCAWNACPYLEEHACVWNVCAVWGHMGICVCVMHTCV